MPPIRKYVASHFPQTEEATLQIALKYDLIYAQTSYVYIVLPDLPRPSDSHTLGAPHAVDSTVGAISHTYAQPPMGYGFPGEGGSTSGTFSPPGSTSLGYGMPLLLAQPPTYHTITQPLYYLYP